MDRLSVYRVGGSVSFSAYRVAAVSCVPRCLGRRRFLPFPPTPNFSFFILGPTYPMGQFLESILFVYFSGSFHFGEFLGAQHQKNKKPTVNAKPPKRTKH